MRPRPRPGYDASPWQPGEPAQVEQVVDPKLLAEASLRRSEAKRAARDMPLGQTTADALERDRVLRAGLAARKAPPERLPPLPPEPYEAALAVLVQDIRAAQVVASLAWRNATKEALAAGEALSFVDYDAERRVLTLLLRNEATDVEDDARLREPTHAALQAAINGARQAARADLLEPALRLAGLGPEVLGYVRRLRFDARRLVIDPGS